MKKVSTTLAKQSRKNSQQKLTVGLFSSGTSSHREHRFRPFSVPGHSTVSKLIAEPLHSIL